MGKVTDEVKTIKIESVYSTTDWMTPTELRCIVFEKPVYEFWGKRVAYRVPTETGYRSIWEIVEIKAWKTAYRIIAFVLRWMFDNVYPNPTFVIFTSKSIEDTIQKIEEWLQTPLSSYESPR